MNLFAHICRLGRHHMSGEKYGENSQAAEIAARAINKEIVWAIKCGAKPSQIVNEIEKGGGE